MNIIRLALLIGAGLFASLNLNAQTAMIGSFNRIGTPVQPAPDSIVQVTAEAQGLLLVAPEDLPFGGTFWEVMPGGIMAPLPCPPIDQTLPIYAITDTAFLVDATGGQVTVNTRQLKTMSLTQAATSDVVASALDTQATAIVDLINQVQTASANQQVRTMAMAMGVPTPGGDGGTNSYTPNGASFTIPDYGTNLWIAQWNMASGSVTGIASNTLADVSYDILTNVDLTTTNWGSTGLFIVGSETTNWTALPLMAVNLTNNCFFRLRSWASSDGSGLPDWWQEQNFGVSSGVDPYGNPAGDGYSNLQKFQSGMNPNQFYTPAAPQNFTVSFDGTSSTATVSWSPAPGPVTGYTVSRVYYGDYDQSQTFNVSVGTSSVHDPLTLLPYASDDPTIYAYYSIQANYSGGASASTGQWLEPFTYQQMPTISVIPAADGSAFLAVAKLSAGTAGLRLTRIDLVAEEFGDSSYNTNYFIPVSSLTNGIFQMPAAWANPPVDGYGGCFYEWDVQTVNANGGATSASESLPDQYFLNPAAGENLPGQYFLNPGIESLVPAFYDGRVQMKQNLIYQLRVASVSQLFHASPATINNPGGGVVAGTNYVVSSYNLSGKDCWDLNWQALPVDVLAPFKMNYFYRNFVFDPNAMDSSGKVTNGISSFYSYPTLLNPPVYQFQTPQNGTTSFAAMLGTEASQWLAANGVFNWGDPTDFGLSFDGDGQNCFIAANARNFYGLPFLSAKVVQDEWTEFLSFDYLAVGGTLPVNPNGTVMYVYPETAQPQLPTVEYDFWNLNDGSWNNGVWMPFEPLPGQAGFSPTNAGNAHLMAGVGNSLTIAGYAKLAVQNGYAGVYAYLGQYFDKAYKMTNGIATTNTTGILSPYGNFFATEPGDAALVTLSDLDTGERGTCIVHAVSLQLDKNHDGTMDLSFNGPDATSQNSTFQFWINNNFDRSLYDADDAVNYEDSLNSIEAGKLPQYQRVPDYNFTNYYGQRAIPTKRDLENFTRLWVCGVTSNLLAALPSGSTVTLSWGDVGNPNPTNPVIDLFQAADANGGFGYLTNETSAAAQTNLSQGQYVGRLAPGGSIPLNSPFAPNLWAGSHFIWCGVSNGVGALTLAITDANSNALAQAKAYIQIKDIKEMYERWTLGDNPKKEPNLLAVKAANDLPSNPVVPAFEYATPQDTNTPYILFVHGWNMRTDEKDHFAESAFKRLYWQGYQGRFGSFRWPTDYGFSGSYFDIATDRRNFDNSEFQAWKSGFGLKNMLTRLNILYSGNVYLLAHSMGNIVAGEGLRLAGTNQLVNTYVASQAAITAHAYDDSLADSLFASSSPKTPNIYNDWFAGNNGGAAGRVISFYNTNDYALAIGRWGLDQQLKPDQSITTLGTTYNFDGYPYTGLPHYMPGSADDNFPWLHFEKNVFYTTNYFNMSIIADRYEVSAYAAQARSTALGATPGTLLNIQRNVNLTRLPNPRIWPDDLSGHNYTDHFWHSAEFRGDNAQMQGYWNELLSSEAFGLK